MRFWLPLRLLLRYFAEDRNRPGSAAESVGNIWKSDEQVRPRRNSQEWGINTWDKTCKADKVSMVAKPIRQTLGLGMPIKPWSRQLPYLLFRGICLFPRPRMLVRHLRK